MNPDRLTPLDRPELAEDDNETYEWHISAESVGDRLDKFMYEALDGEISRTQIQLWIKEGHAKVNGETVKPNRKLAEGDEILLIMPEPEVTDIAPEPIPLDIVHEDADVIVINKPRGMVVHPAPGHVSGTVVNALMHHCGDLSGINGRLRPGIVHRIDKDTSGLLMAAKNDKAHLSLAAQLKAHTVTRKYTAVVHGNVTHNHGTIDAPIGRDPHERKMFVVTEKNSKPAVTHFSVLERFGNYTLLELRLETGRTHQIRVHMKFIGHPLVGDPLYGVRGKGLSMEGQALHAGTLGFVHPGTAEYMEFSRPLPPDMLQLLETIRQQR